MGRKISFSESISVAWFSAFFLPEVPSAHTKVTKSDTISLQKIEGVYALLAALSTSNPERCILDVKSTEIWSWTKIKQVLYNTSKLRLNATPFIICWFDLFVCLFILSLFWKKLFQYKIVVLVSQDFKIFKWIQLLALFTGINLTKTEWKSCRFV